MRLGVHLLREPQKGPIDTGRGGESFDQRIAGQGRGRSNGVPDSHFPPCRIMAFAAKQRPSELLKSAEIVELKPE